MPVQRSKSEARGWLNGGRGRVHGRGHWLAIQKVVAVAFARRERAGGLRKLCTEEYLHRPRHNDARVEATIASASRVR